MRGLRLGMRIGAGGRARFSPLSLFTSGEQGFIYDPSDLSTMFQDSAGTTPVTATGQTVGLLLDKSKGLVLGPELVSNTSPNFRVLRDGVNPIASYTTGAILTTGKLYLVTFTITNNVGNTAANFFAGSTNLTAGQVAAGFNGTRTFYAQHTAGALEFSLIPAGATVDFVVSTFSVKELPGNHLTQSSLSNRPIYGIEPFGGRRNLLTYTEQFDNAAWTKLNATITTNNAAAPDGTMTADLVVSTGGETRVGVNPGVVVANTTYTASVFGKFSNANGRYLWFRDFYAGRSVGFDLQTGVVTQADAGITGVVSVSTDGYFRCVATWTTPASPVVANQQFWVQSASGTSAAGGTSGGQCLIWGAQLEAASTATAYQRVTDQWNVTQAGVPSVAYLQYDGSDDFLVTNTITPGTDKAQVFAGVRKLSDAGFAALIETSTGSAINNGTIGLFAPNGSSGEYAYRSRGTASSVALESPVGNVAPKTNIVTGIGDIGADVTRLRINGSQVGADTTTDQGTGNYLAYPAYIGRRAGTSAPFNGCIYSLIVRFGANLSAATITQTENWVAGKTGIYTVEQLIRLNTLNASGVSYNAYAAADSSSNNYPVTNTVLAANGTPYSVL